MSEKGIFVDEKRRSQAWNGIEDLVTEAHDNAVKHGFYDDYEQLRKYLPVTLVGPMERDFILAQIAKIGSEGGEAVQALQKSRDGDELLEELADIVIRVCDLAGFLGKPLDFAQAVLSKMEINRSRPYKHGKVC